MTPSPAPDPEPEPGPLGSEIGRRLWAAANVIAPTTVATTLLFYFGYVATTARFRYFGVYLDMVDLSLQEMLLYGVEAVYPPLIVLAIAGLLVVAAHAAVRWLLVSPDRDALSGWVGLFTVLAGLLAFARGVMGLLVAQVARTESIATTPLSLGGGILATAYGLWLLRTVGIRWGHRHTAPDPPPDDPPPLPPSAATATALAAWLESAAVARIGRYALAWAAVIVVAGSFWAANSFAAAYGRGRALDDAGSLPLRPEVTLYTKEPLGDLPPGVAETPLPRPAKGTFPYRYRGLRLLVESNARLFLVPAHWTAGSSRTFVVPYDGAVRISLGAGRAG